ncbi:MAG: hypothetical protein PHN22_04495 [Candidatus ainarchaeum sp.]|nr:hypothetical protein [Candidatus ainarchaeum sp.]
MLKYLNIFFVIVLLMPFAFAELQPVFLDQNIHYFGEEINFGLVGIIPDDFNRAEFQIQLPIGDNYHEATLSLTNLSDYSFSFPLDFIYNELKIKYVYYNFDNIEILNQEHLLKLEKLSIIENIGYCINSICNNTYFDDVNANEIELTTFPKISDENINFDILLILDGYIIEEVRNTKLPHYFDIRAGEYEIKITPNYGDLKFITKSLFLNIIIMQENNNNLREYLNEIKEQDADKETFVLLNNDESQIKELKTEGEKNNFWIIGLGILGGLIILITILFFNKQKDKNEKTNRRELRKSRGFLFFVFFLFLASFAFATPLDEKNAEYNNLETKFNTLQELFPYPKAFTISVSNSNPQNTQYYPIFATGLNDTQIRPVLNNKTQNLTANLEAIYFSIDIKNAIEKSKTNNNPLFFESGCEQVLEWFQANPITEDPNTLIARTKENLLKNIIITDKKNGYTDRDVVFINNKLNELKNNKKYNNSINPYADYCISEYLTKLESNLGGKYLVEKKILLKINYFEKNTEKIETQDDEITDTIVFLNNKNKDVLEGEFLGSDLNHIFVEVNYVNDILKEQSLVLQGIPTDRIIRKDNLIEGNKISNYTIPYLTEGENLTIKYTAQLINLEIMDSDYGSYYQLEELPVDSSEIYKKGFAFVIPDKSIAALRNKIISNIELTGMVRLNNGRYELKWNPESLAILAEANINPAKFIIIDKKIIINIGPENQKLNLGIDWDYGIILADSSEITLLLEEENTIYLTPNITNLYLELLKKTIIKATSQKNLELIRLQLPIFFIFTFKKNAQTINNEDALYLKTYDEIADFLKNTNLTPLEKNIIFNNLISLTEDFSFPKQGGGLYKFKYKTRLVLNYGLVNYIDNPENISNINIENQSAAMPYLYDNAYLERKGFVDKDLTKFLILGYLGDNYRSYNPELNKDSAYDSYDSYESDFKSQTQKIFVDQNANEQNWGYYKQLISYPFYRTGFEQKPCSYDKVNFPEYFSESYCSVAYNFNSESGNFGTLYNPNNLNEGWLMQDYDFQNNYTSAYRSLLLLEDIDSFKNNKLTFNSNQLKTFNKLNAFLSLIELEAIRKRDSGNTKNYGTALVLSYKLLELWNGNYNALKEYDDSNRLGQQISNINAALAYQATVKLKSIIASDKIMRLDAYKNIYETDFDRFKESIDPSAGFFDLTDSARFMITGSWFETFIFTGTKKDVEKLEQRDRDKYNKLLHGACCIAQRLGELEGVSNYKNWTVAEIKDNYSPYSKNNKIKNDVIGWVTERSGCSGTLRANPDDCATDILYLYNSKEYGKDLSIILNDTKEKKSITNYLTQHYNTKGQINLDIDNGVQLSSTEIELEKDIAKFKPGTIGSVLKFIDAGINPVAIVLTVATVGIGHGLATGTGGFFTRVAGGFTAKLGTSTAGSLASTVGARVVYELGENVVIDGTYGALAYKLPNVAGKHPFLTCILLGVVAGNFQKPLASLDNAAKIMTTDIITNAGLKNADSIKIQTAIKESLNLDYQDTAEQLLKLKSGESATDAFFKKLPKVAAGSVDDELVNSIQKNLVAQKISVSADVIKKSLENNNIYLTTRATAVSKFKSTKSLIEINRMVEANLDESSDKFIKLATNRTVPERHGIKFANIVDEFDDLKRFNEIDPEHFAKPTRIIYDDFGNPLGYEMDKINGFTLADYIEGGGTLDDSFYKRIEDSVEKLHKQGYAHGDINPRNIIITQTPEGLDFKIIDPVGFRKLADNVNLRSTTDTIINDDTINVRNLKNYTTSDQIYYQTNYVPKNTASPGIKSGDYVVIENSTTNKIGKIQITQDGRYWINFSDGSSGYYNELDIINMKNLDNYKKLVDTSYINTYTDDYLGGPFLETPKKLPDTFIFKSTNNLDGREIILVDKLNDPILKNFLSDLKLDLKNLSRRDEFGTFLDKVSLVKQRVDSVMSHYQDLENRTNLLKNIINNKDVSGQVVPLGYFINNNIGVCRHRALLYKLALDEIDIRSTIVRGWKKIDGLDVRHSWVEINDPGISRMVNVEVGDGFELVESYKGVGFKQYLLPDEMYVENYVGIRSISDLGLVADEYLLLYTPPKGAVATGDGFLHNRNPYQHGYSTTKNLQTIEIKINNALKNNYSLTTLDDSAFNSDSIGYALRNINSEYSSNDITQLMIYQHQKIQDYIDGDMIFSHIYKLDNPVSRSYLTTDQILSLKERVVADLKQQNIIIRLAEDGSIQKSYGAGKYSSLTMISSGESIISIEKSAFNDISIFSKEMQKNYAVWRFSKLYGSKDKIPVFLIPTPDGQGVKPIWATEYYTDYYSKNYNELFN